MKIRVPGLFYFTEAKLSNNYFIQEGGGGVAGLAGLESVLNGNAYVAEGIVWLRALKAFTLSKIRTGAFSPPTGAAFIGDVLYHATNPTIATSLFAATPANRPTIAIGTYSADSGTPEVTDIADGGWFGICVDQIGSTNAGAKIVFEMI